MFIMLDIGSPENIHLQSQLTAAHARIALEHSTHALECKLARFGVARRSWEASKVLASACCVGLAAVATGLLQIGGVL